jgi:hypothetical protein
MMLSTFLSISLLLSVNIHPAFSRSYLRRSLAVAGWEDLRNTDFVCDGDKYSEDHFFNFDIEVTVEGTCAKPRDVKSISKAVVSMLPSLSENTVDEIMKDEDFVNATNVELRSLACDDLAPTEKIWKTRRGLKPKWHWKFSTDPSPTEPIDVPVDKPVDEPADQVSYPTTTWTLSGGGVTRLCYSDFKGTDDIVKNIKEDQFEAKREQIERHILANTNYIEGARNLLDARHGKILEEMKLEMEELITQTKKESLDLTIEEMELEAQLLNEISALVETYGAPSRLPESLKESMDAREAEIKADFDWRKQGMEVRHMKQLRELGLQHEGRREVLAEERKALEDIVAKELHLLDIERAKVEAEEAQWRYLQKDENRLQELREISNEDFYWVLNRYDTYMKKRVEQAIRRSWEDSSCLVKEPSLKSIVLTPQASRGGSPTVPMCYD